MVPNSNHHILVPIYQKKNMNKFSFVGAPFIYSYVTCELQAGELNYVMWKWSKKDPNFGPIGNWTDA